MILRIKDRRSSFSQTQQELMQDLGVPLQGEPRVLRGCKIVGIVGPRDSESELEREEEAFHFWAIVELPESYGSTILRLPIGHTDHEIYTLYGNGPALVGKGCEIVYKGSTLVDIAAGFIKLDFDRRVEQPHAASQNKSFNPIALPAGMISADITKEIKYLTESFEKVGPNV